MANEPEIHVIELPRPATDMVFRLLPPEPTKDVPRPGRFRMGDYGKSYREAPREWVELTQPYWMAETPVTQAQFALWTERCGIEHKNHFAGNPTHPAENMSWREAMGFCQWLTQTHGSTFPKGFEFATLPTEAEWEYACRARTETEFYSGDGEAALSQVGWFDSNSAGSTQPVQTKEPNPFGLFDMHGNVWEWVYDHWDDDAYRSRPAGARDPGAGERWSDLAAGMGDALASNQHRVLRGGSWSVTARNCRSAFRNWYPPDVRGRLGGFRVCLVRGPVPARKNSTARTGAERSGGDGGDGTEPKSQTDRGAEVPDLGRERM